MKPERERVMANKSDKESSPVPPGAYVELNVDLIDEGKFRAHLESKMKQALKDLLQYEEDTMDRSGSAMVTLKFKMSRTKGSSEFFDLEYTVANQVPNVVRASTAKEANGRLICQPTGTSEDSPDQQLFFDRNGRIIGKTGGEESPVAGRIGKQA